MDKLNLKLNSEFVEPKMFKNQNTFPEIDYKIPDDEPTLLRMPQSSELLLSEFCFISNENDQKSTKTKQTELKTTT